jgi:hypothetical protein
MVFTFFDMDVIGSVILRLIKGVAIVFLHDDVVRTTRIRHPVKLDTNTVRPRLAKSGASLHSE